MKGGEVFTLTTKEIVGDVTRASVSFSRLPKAVKPGDALYLNDGFIQLEVTQVEGDEVRCKVVVGGELRSRKGLNLPDIDLGITAFTDRDRECLRFAMEQGVDAVSQSFVESGKDIRAVREAAKELGRNPFIIAKIERSRALERFDEILDSVDGIMIARGDLGVEVPIERIAVVQKDLMRRANRKGKPVITATQMLESMTTYRRPTRAEATDVANAILDGTDALMLSGETAAGAYPLESLQTMVRIAQRTEADRFRAASAPFVRPAVTRDIAEAVSHAACETARHLGAAAIITPTASGQTARMVSKYRPPMPILAVTPSPAVRRRLCMLWGVYPLLAKRTDSTDEMVKDAVWAARSHGFVNPGDLVVLTAGAAGSAERLAIRPSD